ncbi:MAG: ABC transporter ATP-binding protein [Ardenticatenaceae bacterium]|nr:ABC transporter ATP-binding protein [Ardenticatenaceae bacterium]
MSLIRTKNLTRIYHLGEREIPALQGVSLEIDAGQMVALRGRSGSGKTTLLNCISGLDRPTSGRVWLDGEEVTAFNEQERVDLRRRMLGFIFQSHALLPIYSAAENIDFVLRLAGWTRAERKVRTTEVLELVGLKAWMNHRPFELSGGQQQRISIARALAAKPQIVLADEPTGELDAVTSEQVLQMFQRFAHSEKTTILVATHDMMVDEYADEVLYLQDGRILERQKLR